MPSNHNLYFSTIKINNKLLNLIQYSKLLRSNMYLNSHNRYNKLNFNKNKSILILNRKISQDSIIFNNLSNIFNNLSNIFKNLSNIFNKIYNMIYLILLLKVIAKLLLDHHQLVNLVIYNLAFKWQWNIIKPKNH